MLKWIQFAGVSHPIFPVKWYCPRKLTFTRLICVLCLLFRLFCKQNVQLKTTNIETPEHNVVVSIILWRKKHTQQFNLPLHESSFFFQLFTLFSRKISRSREWKHILRHPHIYTQEINKYTNKWINWLKPSKWKVFTDYRQLLCLISQIIVASLMNVRYIWIF